MEQTVNLVVLVVFAFLATRIPYSFFESKKKWLYGVAGFFFFILTPLAILFYDKYTIINGQGCKQIKNTELFYQLVTVLEPILVVFVFVSVAVFVRGFVSIFLKKPAKLYFVWSIIVFFMAVAVWGLMNLVAPTMSLCIDYSKSIGPTESISPDANWGLE